MKIKLKSENKFISVNLPTVLNKKNIFEEVWDFFTLLQKRKYSLKLKDPKILTH